MRLLAKVAKTSGALVSIVVMGGAMYWGWRRYRSKWPGKEKDSEETWVVSVAGPEKSSHGSSKTEGGKMEGKDEIAIRQIIVTAGGSVKSSVWSWASVLPEGYLPKVTMGSYGLEGRRSSMEDTMVVASPFAALPLVHLAAVFDGHRGAQASAFCQDKLSDHLLLCSGEPDEILTTTFSSLDSAYKIEEERLWQLEVSKGASPEDRCWVGTTAIVALVVGRRLFVANAGDCRGVLCRGGRALALSRDHTAADAAERARVAAAGGSAADCGEDGWRIGAAGLQVARSLGDGDVLGLTAEPEITEFLLSEEDDFFILASDGLWDKVTNQEAVRVVKNSESPAAAAEMLAKQAYRLEGGDNITAVVVHLRTLKYTAPAAPPPKMSFSAAMRMKREAEAAAKAAAAAEAAAGL